MIEAGDGIMQRRMDAGLCPRCSSDTLKAVPTGQECRCCGLVVAQSRDDDTHDFDTSNNAGSLS